MHAEILARAEGLIADLGLPYRVLDLCAGDLGASSARTFDIEVYAPGADQWLEVSSVSWFSDFQARRANVRYRPAERQGHRDLPHAQRLGPRSAPRVGRAGRDEPPAGRVGARARAPPPLHAWPRGHHPVTDLDPPDPAWEGTRTELRHRHARRRRDAPDEPIALLRRWLDDAVSAGVSEPTAMTIATIGADGRPAAQDRADAAARPRPRVLHQPRQRQGPPARRASRLRRPCSTGSTCTDRSAWSATSSG